MTTRTDEIAARLAGAIDQPLYLKDAHHQFILGWQAPDHSAWSLIAIYRREYAADAALALHAPADIAFLLSETARLRAALETIENIESGRMTHTRTAGDVARAALEGREG